MGAIIGLRCHPLLMAHEVSARSDSRTHQVSVAGSRAGGGSLRLPVRRDKADPTITSPDFDRVSVKVLACFDQHRIVILALDDFRRANDVAPPIQFIESIVDHILPPATGKNCHEASRWAVSFDNGTLNEVGIVAFA